MLSKSCVSLRYKSSKHLPYERNNMLLWWLHSANLMIYVNVLTYQVMYFPVFPKALILIHLYACLLIIVLVIKRANKSQMKNQLTHYSSPCHFNVVFAYDNYIKHVTCFLLPKLFLADKGNDPKDGVVSSAPPTWWFTWIPIITNGRCTCKHLQSVRIMAPIACIQEGVSKTSLCRPRQIT